MLIKDPAKRPSMRKILEKEFLSRRISKLLTSTIAKSEFSATFLKKHITPYTKVILLNSDQPQDQQDGEESKDSDNSASEDNTSVVSKSGAQQPLSSMSASSQTP